MVAAGGTGMIATVMMIGVYVLSAYELPLHLDLAVSVAVGILMCIQLFIDIRVLNLIFSGKKEEKK